MSSEIGKPCTDCKTDWVSYKDATQETKRRGGELRVQDKMTYILAHEDDCEWWS